MVLDKVGTLCNYIIRGLGIEEQHDERRVQFVTSTLPPSSTDSWTFENKFWGCSSGHKMLNFEDIEDHDGMSDSKSHFERSIDTLYPTIYMERQMKSKACGCRGMYGRRPV